MYYKLYKKVCSFIQRQIYHLQYDCKNKNFLTSGSTIIEKKSNAKNAVLACKHFQAFDKNLQGDEKFTPTKTIPKLATTEQLGEMRNFFDTEVKNTSSRRSILKSFFSINIIIQQQVN